MSWGALILAAAAGASVQYAPIAFAPTAIAQGPNVRLVEIADLSTLPAELRSRAETLVVARFAPGQRVLSAPISRLTERARAGLPILAAYLPFDPTGEVTIRRASATATSALAAERPCLRILEPVAAGAGLRADQVEPTVCGSPPALRATYYDRRANLTRAARALAKGETIAAAPAASLVGVETGASITLKARVGPVAIERQVTAVQAARPGEQVFVVGDDSRPFAASPLAEDQP